MLRLLAECVTTLLDVVISLSARPFLGGSGSQPWRGRQHPCTANVSKASGIDSEPPANCAPYTAGVDGRLFDGDIGPLGIEFLGEDHAEGSLDAPADPDSWTTA